MTYRMIALLAWLLATPGLVLAQSTTSHAPARSTAATAAPTQPAPSPVDVNSADEKTLESLPGVGPARAKAIVANRPYSEKQQLVDKKALPGNVFAALQDRLALVNVNRTSAAEMARILPNVGPIRAQQIVDKRPYPALADVVSKGALTAGVFDGLKGLITAGP